MGERVAEANDVLAPATPTLAGSLPLTGERTVPGVPAENYWFRRHEAAYRFVRPLVGGRVLEIGCGEGYGTAYLAAAGAGVVGIDYDRLTTAHASRTYPTARFVRGNLAALPVADGAVDAVVSLQVIEHVWDHAQFLAECRRALRPRGVLVLSTPNRLTFSPGRDRPTNLFHTHEFTSAELHGLVVRCGFRVSDKLGLTARTRLRELDQRHGGSFVDAQLGTAPDEWDETLRRDVASIAVNDFAVSADDVDGALDLLVVATPAD
jgi:SAM-dependent methyltransferase